jgi:hypothetical protein
MGVGYTGGIGVHQIILDTPLHFASATSTTAAHTSTMRH